MTFENTFTQAIRLNPDIATTKGKLEDLRQRYHEAVTAAGENAIAKQHAKGKKTARERIEALDAVIGLTAGLSETEAKAKVDAEMKAAVTGALT